MEERIPVLPPFNMDHSIVDITDVVLWQPLTCLEYWPYGNSNGVLGMEYFPGAEAYVTMQYPPEQWLLFFRAVPIGVPGLPIDWEEWSKEGGPFYPGDDLPPYWVMDKCGKVLPAPTEYTVFDSRDWIAMDVSKRIIPDVEPLVMYYVSEAMEQRFSTDLLEILKESGIGTPGLIENWTKFDIQTRPDHYTEFVLPAVPSVNPLVYIGGTVQDYFKPDMREYPGSYLITTSLIAPNSRDDRPVRGGDFQDARVAFSYNMTGGYDPYVNTLVRVYGDVQPYGMNKPFYANWKDPFNPAAIVTDSITFDPAILEHDPVEYPMSTQSKNIDLKTELRAWYEPCYEFNKNKKSAIVAGTTYMIIDSENKMPFHGGATSTYFAFPIVEDETTEQVGLELFENIQGTPLIPNLVKLTLVEGTTDTYGKTTNGTIRIEKKYTLAPGEVVQFLDHKLQYVSTSVTGDSTYCRLWYAGNDADDSAIIVTLNQNEIMFFDRFMGVSTTPHHPSQTWYARFEGIPQSGHVDITVGKELQWGDVFYVDSVRYEVVAIEVIDDTGDGEADKFKYITLRTPFAKGGWGGTFYDSGEPASSQWITRLQPCDPIPVLPPFNVEHEIVDDTDVVLWQPLTNLDEWPIGDPNGVPCMEYFPYAERYLTMQYPPYPWLKYFRAVPIGVSDLPIDWQLWESYGGPFYPGTELPDNWTCCLSGDVMEAPENYTVFDTMHWIAHDVSQRIISPVAPLEFSWVSETKESRYSTNLLQVLNETVTGEEPVEEVWTKYEIQTLPAMYTEFDLSVIPSIKPDTREHPGSYLITASFLAPNAGGDLNRNQSYEETNRFAFSLNASHGAGIYVGEYIPPNLPPNPPANIAQFKSDSATEIPVGCTTDERIVIFKGNVSDSDGDQVKLQVELRRLDEYGGEFDETKGGLFESTLVENGSEAVVSRGELIDADYHWRARAIDEHGEKSEWVEFGDNDLSEVDFTVIGAIPSGTIKVSLNGNVDDATKDWKYPTKYNAPVFRRGVDNPILILDFDSQLPQNYEGLFEVYSPRNDERIDKAIEWAENQLGSHEYDEYCWKFVVHAYKKTGADWILPPQLSAKEAANSLKPLKTGIPPRGTLVFYDCWGTLEEEYRNWGHVGLSIGNGDVIHAFGKVRVDNHLDIQDLSPGTGWTNPEYIGWVEPPVNPPIGCIGSLSSSFCGIDGNSLAGIWKWSDTKGNPLNKDQIPIGIYTVRGYLVNRDNPEDKNFIGSDKFYVIFDFDKSKQSFVCWKKDCTYTPYSNFYEFYLDKPEIWKRAVEWASGSETRKEAVDKISELARRINGNMVYHHSACDETSDFGSDEYDNDFDGDVDEGLIFKDENWNHNYEPCEDSANYGKAYYKWEWESWHHIPYPVIFTKWVGDNGVVNDPKTAAKIGWHFDNMEMVEKDFDPEDRIPHQHSLGVCQDYAMLTVGYLRAIGMPSRPVIAEGQRQTLFSEPFYHAWLQWFENGKWNHLDSDFEAKNSTWENIKYEALYYHNKGSVIFDNVLVRSGDDCSSQSNIADQYNGYTITYFGETSEFLENETVCKYEIINTPLFKPGRNSTVELNITNPANESKTIIVVVELLPYLGPYRNPSLAYAESDKEITVVANSTVTEDFNLEVVGFTPPGDYNLTVYEVINNNATLALINATKVLAKYIVTTEMPDKIIYKQPFTFNATIKNNATSPIHNVSVELDTHCYFNTTEPLEKKISVLIPVIFHRITLL
jgi:hypothetical protein